MVKPPPRLDRSVKKDASIFLRFRRPGRLNEGNDFALSLGIALDIQHGPSQVPVLRKLLDISEPPAGLPDFSTARVVKSSAGRWGS
jgi:hypothetical protein